MATETHQDALWPGNDSWIDLDEVRASLLACVDPKTGAVNEAALAKVEFDHNRRVALEILQAVPPTRSLGIDVAYSDSRSGSPMAHRGRATVVRHGDGFGFDAHAGIDPSARWTDEQAADAIAAVSVMMDVIPSRINDVDGTYFFQVQGLWDRRWMRAVVASLAVGPGSAGWTAEAIDGTGAVLRTLIDLCERRSANAVGVEDRPPPYAAFCLWGVSTLADAIRAARDPAEAPVTRTGEWARITDVRESLRGMLAWIDAMERTDALFEHVLKRYQVERATRMFDDDSS